MRNRCCFGRLAGRALRSGIILGCVAAIVASPAAAAWAQQQAADPVRDVSPAKIDEIFAHWSKPNSPGMVVAVIRDGTILYQRGYGMANLELDVPLSVDSVFYIASMSKQFTAASIALLARDGKIALDDDVREYIPDLPDYGAPITVRHLVHHTSGLRDYGEVMAIGGREDQGMTTDDAVRWITRQKELNFPPGEEFSYTNSGYILMAAIVKRASGKTLRAFADERIFRPLGMKRTLWRDDNTMIIKHRAVGHASAAGSFRTDDPLTQAMGPGNLWTTVGDLFWWDQNFYSNRLTEGLIDQLLTPGKLNGGQSLDYAFGLFVDRHKGLKRVHHGGAFAGFRTEMVRFPDERLTVICLSNLASVEPHGLCMRVAELYLADRLAARSSAGESPQVTLPADALAALAGAYRDPRDGSLRRFAVRDDRLVLLQEIPAPHIKLEPTGQTTFRGTAGGAEIVFAFTAAKDGKLGQVRIAAEGTAGQTFDAATIASPTAVELKACAGTFFSDEADATLQLRVERGRLQLEGPLWSWHTLRPGIRDEFVTSSSVLQLERDAEGRVTGFRLSSPRVRKLRFIRQSQG